MTRGKAQALYIDTSCLLKLFIREPESPRVIELLGEETQVVVSELARFEAETQLRARLRGGVLTKTKHSRLARELAATLLGRLLTNDSEQATMAQSLGVTVVLPR